MSLIPAEVNEVDFNTPARFAYQELMQSNRVEQIVLEAMATWQGRHGDRLYEDVRVPPEREYPYGVITASEPDIIQAGGLPGRVEKARTVIEVVSVQDYPTGRGSWFPFNPITNALRKALTGVCGLDVFDEDGNRIGAVHQSSFLREVRRTNPSGDYEVLHCGILVDVIWQS